jgi:phosphoribosyl 1,2-cyclic phosphodiesterase
MRVQFWGTRGSIATPGANMARYGGNTSCIEVRSATGTLVIIDCGTGAHALGQKLMSGGAKGLRGHILISHTHWDHIQGIPFFGPLFAPGNEWDIYGPQSLGQSLREALAGQMQYTYFPITLDQCQANIRYHDLIEGVFNIDDIRVSTLYLNHPALTLGYRLEADGITVVYACDHEPYSRMLATGHGDFTGQDLRHAEFVDRADLLIHDAQYTADEYSERVGWGHSPIEYVVNLARYAQAKSVALTHHDPSRDDDAIDRLVAKVRDSSSLDVFAAAEGKIVEIATPSIKRPAGHIRELQAEMPVQQSSVRQTVLFHIEDMRTVAVLSRAVRAEGICAKPFSNIDEARMLIMQDRPLLMILEHDPPRINGINMCRTIRREANIDEPRLPVLIVAEREDQDTRGAAGVTDWLIKPYTLAYLRTRIRAWILRSACHRIRERRLAPSLPQKAIARKPFLGAGLDKSSLLWMYCREIAPFETPSFSSKVGEIISQATTTREKRTASQR